MTYMQLDHSQVKRIALLMDSEEENIQIQEFRRACDKRNIEIALFISSEAILDYQPDFVIVTTPEHAKLTPYPTYGLINRPRDEYLELPRYLRNILTYDGYLTTSPRLQQMLQDIMFGTRKLNTKILRFDFFPALINYSAPELNNDIVIFEPNFDNTRFTKANEILLSKIPQAKLLAFTQDTQRYFDRTILVNDINILQKTLHNAGIAICLLGGDAQEELISPAALELIASSSVTVVQHTKQLEEVFGNNLYYIPSDTPLLSLGEVVNLVIKKITHQPELAIAASKHAHQQFTQSFALDSLLNDLLYFHEQTLIDKGFVIHPDKSHDTALPSVTYIMRTGGKHRAFLERALNCLVAQNYPDLRVIFVIHAYFDYLPEIIAQYPSLKIKVIESIKSRRSEAIRDGMAAVETDLFGLFDDDDELFPNHVRSLVRALQYHNNRDWRGEIGMVYSGSIHADDTYPVEERVEYRDHKLKNQFEKRAIEHFKFYSSTLMARHAWFMPNGWLARAKLIDNELLTDPQIDTCEDLYFELQIAQRAHFAFSMEVTAIHNFHHLGNSTIDDSHKHIPDTQRIALRNLGRVFPPDAQYDTSYSILGRKSAHDPNQIAYQDYSGGQQSIDYYESHPFFPLRIERKDINYNDPAELAYAKLQLSKIPTLPFKFIKYSLRFLRIPREKKLFYFKKFKSKVATFGFLPAMYLMLYKLQSKTKPGIEQRIIKANQFQNNSLRDRYYRFRISAKYKGWSNAVKSLFNLSSEKN